MIKPIYDVLSVDPNYEVSYELKEIPNGEDSDLCIVTSWVGSWRSFKQKGILIPHGIAENERGNPFPPTFKRIFLSGIHFSQGLGNEQIVGFPKSDYLFGSRKVEEIKKAEGKWDLGTLPWKKTVLVNGPYYAEGDIWNSFLPLLINLSKSNGFNLLVKIREEILYQKNVGNVRIKDIKEKNIRFIRGCDNNWSLFPFSDVSLGGWSSTLREFTATRKPSFFMAGGKLQPTNPHEETGEVYPNTLEKTILEAFDHPEKWIVDDKLLEQFFYKLDGKVTERIVEEIRKL